jgi:hypothetical protein
MCSTPGASVARRALPLSKRPKSVSSAAAGPATGAIARSASFAIISGSSAPATISRLRGLSGGLVA